MPYSGSGGVWGITSGEYADQNFPGSQTGYDDARTHAATLGGKVLLGPTLTPPTLGTLAGNVGFIYHDSNGRIRIAKFRVADDTDPTKLLKLDLAAIAAATERVITIPNYSGFLPLPAVEGPANQFLRGGGTGVQPSWATIAGAPGGVNYKLFVPREWVDDSSVKVVSGGGQEYPAVTGYLGTSDNNNEAVWTVAGDFSSVASWKLFFGTNGTSVNNLVWRFGLAKYAAGSTMASNFTVTDTTVAGAGAVDQLVIVTLSAPSVSFAAGDTIKLRAERRATGDVNDTNTDAARLAGVLLTYNS